ncbi:Esterase P [Carabus blaptoides fortunei]
MLKVLLVLATFVIVGLYADDRPLVDTSNGRIRGTIKTSRKGRRYVAFEGIPYAKPPVGDLRFKEPQAQQPWTGIWDAQHAYSCSQITYISSSQKNVIGTEDCLYLNVYTPELTTDKKYDVFVQIHGGAFMLGNADINSSPLLLDKDIVLVMMNYRLGPLELYHRAISMSGTALTNWVLVENPLQKARELGVIVGCGQVATQDLVRCLRQRSATQIIQATTHFQPWLANPFTTFGPTVELAGDNKFLPDLPYNLLQQGHVADVPWITSVTSDEGLYPGADFLSSDRLPYLEQHWTELAPYILQYDGTVPRAQQADVAQKIKEYYLKDEPISRETFPALVQAIGDRLFVVDAEKAARLQAQVNKSPVYFYRFNYRGGHSISEFLTQSDENLGVSHGDDALYITLPVPGWLESEADDQMVDLFLDMWISYGQTGTPKVVPATWQPVSPSHEHFQYLHIGSPHHVEMKQKEYLAHNEFWNALPFQENDLISTITDEF